MTTRRHRNYRRALNLIGEVDPLWLSAPARACLEDRVEAMLLSREENQASVRQLRAETAHSIRELAGAGMLPQAVADELEELMLAAGPPSHPMPSLWTLRHHSG